MNKVKLILPLLMFAPLWVLAKSFAGVVGTDCTMPSVFTPSLSNAELEIANYYDGNQSANSRFSSLSLSSTSVSQKSQLTGVIACQGIESLGRLILNLKTR